MTRRGAGVGLGALALIAGLTVALLQIALPAPPPASVPRPEPFGPPLTRQLVLVIIDGLRHDHAADPSIMPHLATRLRATGGHEVWANRVTMTSSAVLSYGTGQRGDLEQIARNESSRPTAHDHLPGAARRAGLVTAATGDRAWFFLYPDAWHHRHPDPEGVAIDVDYNAEIFEAARRFFAVSPRPHLVIAHFVTPDHQAHAHGLRSERYRAHLRGFDEELARLLDEIPRDATVFVTSDHGATDTGTHGSDTEVQRRSPLVAYGAGIVSGALPAPRAPIEQIDLPPTFAALLGIAAPAHARGHALVEWLDLDDARRAEIACADLARLERYAAAELGAEGVSGATAAACAAGAPEARVARAGREAARLDANLEARRWGVGPAGAAIVLFAFLAAAALARHVLAGVAAGGRFRLGLGLAATLLVVAVGLTFGLELLPGGWPDGVRAALYACANLALIAALFTARRTTAWLDRNVLAGAALFPGLLVVSETKSTQPEAFVTAALIALLAFAPRAPPRRPPGAEAPPLRGGVVPRALAIAASFAFLAPLAWREHSYLPAAVLARPEVTLAVAMGSILLAAAVLALRAGGGAAARSRLALAGAAAAVAIVSLLLRRSAPAPVCVAGWLGLPVVALVAHRAGQRPAAELLLFGSYAWVSRDAEVPVVAATFLVAALLGDAFAARAREESVGEVDARVRPSLVLLLVAFAFSWTYLQRLGVQLGLDFPHLDWGAGGFREPGVSVTRIAAALVYKHALVRALLLVALLAPLPPAYRVWTARGLLVAELLRLVLVTALLVVCGHSFWTSLRAIGEMPHGLVAVLVAAGAVVVVERKRGEARAPSAAPRAADGNACGPQGVAP